MGAEAVDNALNLAPEPATEKAFKAYGQLIEVPGGNVQPTIRNEAWRFWAGLAKTKIHGDIEFGLFTVAAREHLVAEMERHVKTPELLVSLRDDYLLVVAPPTPPNARKAAPDAAKTKVFMVARDQAIILNKGTWHTLPFPRGKEGLFLAAFRSGTARSDMKYKPFKKNEIVRFKTWEEK